MLREIIEGDVSEPQSAFSDHDHLSDVDITVRYTLADVHPEHATVYDDASWHESVTQTSADSSAELNALLEIRNGCTWHTDFDRNTRIWKLLVSWMTVDLVCLCRSNTNYLT